MDLAFRVLFQRFQIIFDRIRLTFSVATGTNNNLQPNTAVSMDNIPRQKESNATSKIESTWKVRPKFEGLLTCSHVQNMSYRMSQLPVYLLWLDPAKIKRGGHFGVLTGMWVFQDITLHRATNSARSPDSAETQAKIRFAFHFVERNDAYFYEVHKGTYPSPTSSLPGD